MANIRRYRKLPRGDISEPVRNRSLERGIDVLRAFRPGNDLLGNGELAERTGLAPATISRLTYTLVSCGMLEHDVSARAYRLAAPVLSFAHTMRSGSPLLAVATPILQREAKAHRVNAGLASADGDDMIYLESVRYHPRASLRTIVAGQRVPARLTSLGRAWLAGSRRELREDTISAWKLHHRRTSRQLENELLAACESVARHGYCVAAWQPGVVSLGAPLVLRSGTVMAVNMSVSGAAEIAPVVKRLAAPLLRMRDAIAERATNDGP